MTVHAHITSPKPRLELADVVRAYAEQLCQQFKLTAEQRQALWAIAHCRTAALGGFVYHCKDCHFEQIQYRSCGNRHCPKCQCVEQQKWIESREQKLLGVSYCHVVFTLPSELRTLTQFRLKHLLNILFHCASDTLLSFGSDSKHLGALLGITAVLHTWDGKLCFHPHLHCIVTAGGLSSDGLRWISSPPKFLFPVKALAKTFRSKFVDGLRKLRSQGFLDGFGDFDDPQGFDRLIASLLSKSWNVYCKPAFRKAHYAFRYLGRYTHRVGISNSRLVAMHDGSVTFRTKTGKRITLGAVHFLRRFVQHVLPKRFVKIRHYGLFAPANVNTKLVIARQILTAEQQPIGSTALPSSLPTESWQDALTRLTGRDLSRCPRCQSRSWHATRLPPIRAPPVAA